MRHIDRVCDSIVALIASSGGVRCRASIESELCHRHQISARTVTRALRVLLSGDRGIVKGNVELPGNRIANIYLDPSAAPVFIEQTRRLLILKTQTFCAQELRKAGEDHVRSLFVKSRAFHTPQRHRLGNIPTGLNREPADMIVCLRNDRHAVGRIVIEVKNQREVFYPTSPALPLMIRKAIALNATPVFAMAFASARMQQFCELAGIGLLVLGYQVVPRLWRPMVAYLRPVIGPTPFLFASPSRPLRSIAPATYDRVIVTITDPAWLESTALRWRANLDLAKDFLRSDGPQRVKVRHYHAALSRRRYGRVRRFRSFRSAQRDLSGGIQ